MFKKVIGLAALAGVSLMVTGIGCSVTTTNTTTDGGPTADATPTTTATGTGTTPTDGGKKPDGSTPPPATCEADLTGKAAAVKASIFDAANYGPYVSTPAAAGQCTAANITDFTAYIKTLPTGATFEQVIAKLNQISPTCGACTFKAQTGTSWGPFVTATTSTGGIGAFSNIAGCFEARGVGKACAESLFAFDKCVDAACGKCADGAEADACEQATYAKGGQCESELGPDLQAKCSADTKFQAAGDVCEVAGNPLIINLMTGACGAP